MLIDGDDFPPSGTIADGAAVRAVTKALIVVAVVQGKLPQTALA